jgi:hypothetical protein
MAVAVEVGLRHVARPRAYSAELHHLAEVVSGAAAEGA